MKTIKLSILIVIAGLFLTGSTVLAQSNKVYKDGSVWSISFIKTVPGMGDDYLKSLKVTWKAVHDEAIKQGLLLSYKILTGAASGPNDWNMMLMQEYKNLASMEGADDKWEAIEKKVIGGEDAMKTLMQNRVSMREIYGEKLMREIIYN